ncbi:hypothetical protein BDW75DRAFT_243034 [Aspergillus navahoensis]
MTDNYAWVRRVIFPLTAIDNAAMAFLKLQNSNSPRLLGSIMFIRAPPSAPIPREPIISLTAVYYGPVSDAEQSAADLFNPELLRHSSAANTSTVSLHKMNDGTEFLNKVGGYKQLGNALLCHISLDSIRQGAKAWSRSGDEHQDAKERTIIFCGNWSTASAQRNMLLPGTDRKGFLQVLVWYMEDNTTEPAKEFMEDMLRIGRRRDNENGSAPVTFPNNQLLGGRINEVYSENRSSGDPTG